jgi:hypothetical protein
VRLSKAGVTAHIGDQECADLGGNVCAVGHDLPSLRRRGRSARVTSGMPCVGDGASCEQSSATWPDLAPRGRAG